MTTPPSPLPSPPAPAPGSGVPITAPPAPRTLNLPHNLHTLDETITALQRLAAGGLGPHQDPYVRIRWRNGGDRRLLITQLPQIADLDDVESLWLAWTFADGSTVAGHVLNRPQAGELKVEQAGQALAGASACQESLRGLRQQRAAVRGLLAGIAPMVLIMIAFLALALVGALSDSQDNSPEAGLTAGRVALNLAAGVALGAVAQVLASWIRRRIGGTRLAQPSQVNRTVFTPELGVLAAVLAAVVAFGSLIVSLVAA